MTALTHGAVNHHTALIVMRCAHCGARRELRPALGIVRLAVIATGWLLGTAGEHDYDLCPRCVAEGRDAR